MTKSTYTGIADEMLRLVETKQLKDRDLWQLVVRQFGKGGADDENKGWRGEYWGKLMRGACMTWSYTRDEELYDVLTEAVKGLLETQDAEGRICTYSKEAEFNGWDMWARKYVLLGLIHFYEICQDEELAARVLKAASAHLDYIVAHVGNGEGQVAITGTSAIWRGINSSSILEPVVRLYNLTGKAEYLEFATYIVNNGGAEGFDMFEAAYADEISPYQYPVDKAYEMMSCFEGLIEYYKATGIEKWRVAAENFAKQLLKTEATVVGSSGCKHEQFNHSSLMQSFGRYEELAPEEGKKRAGLMLETCVTVTWMKLMYAMFKLTGEMVYMDQIECAAFNALYGAVNTEESVCGDETTFDSPAYRDVYHNYVAAHNGKGLAFDSYSPLTAGIRGRAVGGFQSMDEGTGFCGCCVAIGAAGTALVPMAAANPTEEGMAVNIYLPGLMVRDNVGSDKAEVALQIETKYPVCGEVTLTVMTVKHAAGFACEKAAEQKETDFELALRIPAFAEGSTAEVNGEAVEGVQAGRYLTLNRRWKEGDQITLHIAMNPRLVFGQHNPEDPGSEHRTAVLYGPLTLARDKRLGEVGTVIPISTQKLQLTAVTPEQISFPVQCAFTVDIDGTALTMVDYASAGKTWRRDSEMEVWMLTEQK